MRFNVGFLLRQGAGSSREYEIDTQSIQVGDDLELAFLRGTVRFTRTTQGLYLQGALQAATELDCDRCLAEYQQRLVVEFGELYQYPAQAGEEAAPSVPESGWLNLMPLVREVMLLELPSHPLCRLDCAGLCPQCGANRNEEQCDHPDQEIDPRLAKLKSLLP